MWHNLEEPLDPPPKYIFVPAELCATKLECCQNIRSPKLTVTISIEKSPQEAELFFERLRTKEAADDKVFLEVETSGATLSVF
mmetsp:Transcript_15737/g.23692  ORF Transcript_15737/g.23692 Transcript_15737/m.23692 type:complete len:83 (+) Transcript_15737:404-652(+)